MRGRGKGEYLGRYPRAGTPPGRYTPGRYTPRTGTHPLGRYTSGRYASHWNAFLSYYIYQLLAYFWFCLIFCHSLECPLDHYKSADNSATSCTRCPDHSHTASKTSNNILQCLCDTGYEGPDGGPCTSKVVK